MNNSAAECFCGNTIGASGQITDDSECNFACTGDALERCGAGNRLGVYKFGLVSQTSSTAVSST